MIRVPYRISTLLVAISALSLAGCETPSLKTGSFAASIQQFKLPADLAAIFNGKPKKARKVALRNSGKTARNKAVPLPDRKPEYLQAKAVELQADDVRALLLENSLYAAGGGLEFAALHRADGEMVGRSWSQEDTRQGDGEWRIEADGTYCRKWHNEWADGEWGCFKVLRNDAKLVLKRQSGAGTDGDMTLVPGNAYGL